MSYRHSSTVEAILRRYGPPPHTKQEIDTSDLLKIRDALSAALQHHKRRDEANAELHLSTVRYSPLTSVLEAAVERVDQLRDR